MEQRDYQELAHDNEGVEEENKKFIVELRS